MDQEFISIQVQDTNNSSHSVQTSQIQVSFSRETMLYILIGFGKANDTVTLKKALTQQSDTKLLMQNLMNEKLCHQKGSSEQSNLQIYSSKNTTKIEKNMNTHD